MNAMKRFGSVFGLAAAVLLGACAATNAAPARADAAVDASPGYVFSAFGVVSTIEPEWRDSDGAGVGADVGHGQEGRQRHAMNSYRITVRMDDGSHRTLTQASSAGFRVGDRVRVGDGALQWY